MRHHLTFPSDALIWRKRVEIPLYTSGQILGYRSFPVWPLVSGDFCVSDVWLLVGIVNFTPVTSIPDDCHRDEVRSLIGLTPGDTLIFFSEMGLYLLGHLSCPCMHLHWVSFGSKK